MLCLYVFVRTCAHTPTPTHASENKAADLKGGHGLDIMEGSWEELHGGNRGEM